ncbi:MAG: hypothetical protein AAF580_07890 [Pseudomonadota bacterium]
MRAFAVFDGRVRILSSDTVNGVCVLRLEAPPQCLGAGPGQYVLLRHDSGPFLPRPLSIVSDEGGLLIAANLWGAGTAAIAKAAVGDTLNLTGPLGNTFTDTREALTMVTDLSHVGGVLALAVARRRPDDVLMMVAAGGSERRSLDRLCALTHVPHRLVSPDAVEDALVDCPARLAISVNDDVAHAIQRFAAAYARPGEALLHAMMACGLGACHACVHPMRGGAPALVCDGPVFDLQAPDFTHNNTVAAA